MHSLFIYQLTFIASQPNKPYIFDPFFRNIDEKE